MTQARTPTPSKIMGTPIVTRIPPDFRTVSTAGMLTMYFLILSLGIEFSSMAFFISIRTRVTLAGVLIYTMVSSTRS
jgi:hypothetical protein